MTRSQAPHPIVNLPLVLHGARFWLALFANFVYLYELLLTRPRLLRYFTTRCSSSEDDVSLAATAAAEEGLDLTTVLVAVCVILGLLAIGGVTGRYQHQVCAISRVGQHSCCTCVICCCPHHLFTSCAGPLPVFRLNQWWQNSGHTRQTRSRSSSF